MWQYTDLIFAFAAVTVCFGYQQYYLRQKIENPDHKEKVKRTPARTLRKLHQHFRAGGALGGNRDRTISLAPSLIGATALVGKDPQAKFAKAVESTLPHLITWFSKEGDIRVILRVPNQESAEGTTVERHVTFFQTVKRRGQLPRRHRIGSYALESVQIKRDQPADYPALMEQTLAEVAKLGSGATPKSDQDAGGKSGAAKNKQPSTTPKRASPSEPVANVGVIIFAGMAEYKWTEKEESEQVSGPQVRAELRYGVRLRLDDNHVHSAWGVGLREEVAIAGVMIGDRIRLTDHGLEQMLGQDKDGNARQIRKRKFTITKE